MDIDETDKKIINALLENSRLSYRQLAVKVKVSVATIMHHVNKLEKEKVITGYTAKVDYDKLGYDLHVLMDIRISKGKLVDVEKKIATNNNVYAVYDNTGNFDATILAKFRNTRAMDSFIKKLQTYEFVERTETKIILQTMKDSFIKV